MSLASSCALNRAGLALAGPISDTGPFVAVELEPDIGRADFGSADEVGRSCCRAQSLL